MARGKHANAAAARRVREQAESEAASQTLRADRLEKELIETQGRLNSTLEAMHAETTRLRLIVASGETETTEALHARIRDLDARLADAKREVYFDFWEEVKDRAADQAHFVHVLAETCGVSPQEVSQALSANRLRRRMSWENVREGRENFNHHKARGLA